MIAAEEQKPFSALPVAYSPWFSSLIADTVARVYVP